MSKIKCPSCSRNVVPRLWHVRKPLSYMRTYHLCPFCGVSMYQTGGQLLPIVKIGFVLIVLPIGLSALASTGNGFAVIAILVAIAWGIFTWKKRMKTLIQFFHDLLR